MKYLFAIVYFGLVGGVFGQNVRPIDPSEKEITSFFDKVSSGEFLGTSNGVLFVKNQKGQEFILDFQASKATLLVVADPDQVYDDSRQCYRTATTSGRTKVEYSRYAFANELVVVLDNEEFILTGIDGACDMVISGLDYYYKGERDTEYLVLHVKKSFTLTSEQSKKLTILPNSSLVFAIKKINKN